MIFQFFYRKCLVILAFVLILNKLLIKMCVIKRKLQYTKFYDMVVSMWPRNLLKHYCTIDEILLVI